MLSLWVGPQSQRFAHHFYWLQAEQFFQQDECEHSIMWDVNRTRPRPHAIIYDTNIPQLSRLRNVNHKKMMKNVQKLKKQSCFTINSEPLQNQSQESTPPDPDIELFDNWQSSINNYYLIDTHFHYQKPSFDLWSSLYCEQMTEPIRKQLQCMDSVSNVTITSDTDRSGLSYNFMIYTKEQVPKASLILTALEPTTNTFLPLIGEMQQQSQLMFWLEHKNDKPIYGNVYDQWSNVFNSIVSPIILKNGNQHYVDAISLPKRTVFNCAYGLPVIGSDQQLLPGLNIIQYYSEMWQNQLNRVKFSDNKLLKIQGNNSEQIIGGLLAQSFMLKGGFNGWDQLYRPRTPVLNFRMQQAMISLSKKRQLLYDQFYAQKYGLIAGDHPFQTVLFQHRNFGSSLRQLSKLKTIKTQTHQQWQEKVRQLADRYSQQILYSDDD